MQFNNNLTLYASKGKIGLIFDHTALIGCKRMEKLRLKLIKCINY